MTNIILIWYHHTIRTRIPCEQKPLAPEDCYFCLLQNKEFKTLIELIEDEI